MAEVITQVFNTVARENILTGWSAERELFEQVALRSSVS